MGERASSTMPYVPGIDGLRALALIAIFVFHLGIGWFPGAVFSVTLFFTLSGYLVTSLVLTEFASTGGLDLRRFWARRFRRLMPAALVAISAIGICGLVGVFEGERLRGDVLWAIGYASNWRSAAASTSYSELFGAETSPLLHFWTLAIEEQFYILFPLAAWLLLRNRRLMLSVFIAVTALSVIATVLTSSRNLAYYGTHARVAELTIGVLFAFVFPVHRAWSRVASRRWSIAGSMSLAAFVVLLLTVHTTDAAVYKGALPAFALVATLMIAAVSVDGPMRQVFAWRPLVELGRVSYPAYLFHWPVIVALDEERLGFGGPGLQLVRVVVTLILAFGTARLIEDPIRTRRTLRTRASATLAVGVALIATVVIGILVPSRSAPVLAGVEAPDEVVAFDDATSQSPGSVAPDDSVAPTTDLRSPIVVVGSEGRLAADLNRVVEGVASGSGFRIVDSTQDGCALRLTRPAGSVCEPFRTVVRQEAVASKSDVVVVGVGSAERDLLAESVERVMARPDNTWTADFVLVDESRKLVDRLLDPVVGSFDRIIVVDYIGGDPFWEGLVDADLRFDELVALDASDGSVDGTPDSIDESLSDELARIADETIDARVRIMVIGDSSSFGIAQAIHNVAADRYEVVWAGGRNCPLVEVDRIRWFDGVEFDMEYCPTLESTWRSMIGDLQPALVLEIASVPEQSEQMYEGDATWYTVDDPEFIARHDAVMSELVSLVDAVGGRLVLFDSPAVFGDGLGKAPFAQPDRIAAWNAMLTGWAARWPDIEVLEWSKIVDLVEEIPGELRADDVHMEQDVLDGVVREHVVPVLDGLVSGEASDPLGPTGP